MGLKINMMLDPKRHRCDSCKEHKQLRFSVTHEDHGEKQWHICFHCFRLEEGKLHSQLTTTVQEPTVGH